MDSTDSSLAYGGIAVLAVGMLCCAYSILYETCDGCKTKKDKLLNNGDDGLSEV